MVNSTDLSAPKPDRASFILDPIPVLQEMMERDGADNAIASAMLFREDVQAALREVIAEADRNEHNDLEDWNYGENRPDDALYDQGA